MGESSTNKLLQHIEEKYQGLSKGQKRLADYVVENYDKAVFLTAPTLSEGYGVSGAPDVGSGRQLGYKG